MTAKYHNSTTLAESCGNVFVDEIEEEAFDLLVRRWWITVLAVNT